MKDVAAEKVDKEKAEVGIATFDLNIYRVWEGVRMGTLGRKNGSYMCIEKKDNGKLRVKKMENNVYCAQLSYNLLLQKKISDLINEI